VRNANMGNRSNVTAEVVGAIGEVGLIDVHGMVIDDNTAHLVV
jgi:hypothetical protein